MFGTKKQKHELPHLLERMQAEEKFFSENFVMSYSGLNKLLNSPISFYKHYILNEREDNTDKYTIEGSLVHLLLLNPGDFDKDFVVTPANVPSDNPKKIIQMLFEYCKMLNRDSDFRCELREFEPEILQLLKEENLYQSLKLDSARIEKICDEKGETYWEYLHAAEGRTVIDDVTLAVAKEYVNRITNNITVMELMGMVEDTFNPVEHHNEVELVTFPDNLPFGIRGFLDNMVIDHAKKTIRVNDLKKTSKDILAFRDSVENWKYWLQCGIYRMLVDAVYIKNNPQFEGYTVEFRFIVLDSNMQVGVYQVSEETMQKWVIDTQKELEKARYHFETRNFDLPYEFLVKGQITL
jgi:hypothetical protein